MNFLLRNSFTQQHQQQQPDPAPPDADQAAPSLSEAQISSSDTKSDMSRLRNRVPIQGHTDVSSNEGSLIIPARDFPMDFASISGSAQLAHLDREFILPGEEVNIIVTVSSTDLSAPEIITPFKVAAVISKNSHLKLSTTDKSENDGDYSPEEGEHSQDGGQKAQEGSENTEESEETAGLAARESLLKERQRRRSADLLESFRSSHFYVKISEDHDEDGVEHSKQDDSVLPVFMERDGFDPVGAGGIARRAISTCSLANGDVVVVLQATVAAQANTDKVVIEILQCEQHKSPMSASKDVPRNLDPAQDILHWLLPLDRQMFPPQQQSTSSSASIVATSAQRLSFGSSNSTLFSFSHLRSSSQGSIPQVAPPSAAPGLPPHPPSALSMAPGEWNRLFPNTDSILSHEVGSEGFLSFRGVPLEPQRFSVHCGLQGLYVPGKRWCRKLSIVQPLGITSYFASCNTEDLICVMIENVLPSRFSDVVVYIDSISIICQSANPGSTPQPVPIAIVESGEQDKLPDLPLRIGEQHSFILRPTNTLAKANDIKQMKADDTQQRKADDMKQTKGDDRKQSNASDGNYAVLISCHCSHTHSTFYVKHSLKWKPRPPRDLLLSVSLENAALSVPNHALPQLKSQVVTVQATNLTSKDMDLTLLAPSSLPCTPSPVVSVPNTSSSNKPRVGNSQSFHIKLQKAKIQSTRSMSLPHRERADKEAEHIAESTKKMPESREKMPESTENRSGEEKASTAEIVAANRPCKTHLWLQSTVPLGHVPAHSTTVVKTDLLPLTEGIITLDTLHIATKDRGTLYIPENSLQIHVSGIVSE